MCPPLRKCLPNFFALSISALSAELLHLSLCSTVGYNKKKMSRKHQILELCDKVHRDLKLAGLPTDGCATDGTEHSSIAAMWSSELGFGPMASGYMSYIDIPVDIVGGFL